MTILIQRRHQKAIADINRLAIEREKALVRLFRINNKLQALYRTIRRYEKLPPAKPDKPDLGIPDFLRRGSGDEKDAKVRAEIEAEAEAHKKAKARGRIAKLKAKQAGETKRMPLTGKAALDFINQGRQT